MNKPMSFSEEITFGNSYDKVEVIGTYYRGHNGIYSTYNDPLGEPPDPSELEIDKILFEGIDILPFIHHEDEDNIKQEILEKLDNE